MRSKHGTEDIRCSAYDSMGADGAHKSRPMGEDISVHEAPELFAAPPPWRATQDRALNILRVQEFLQDVARPMRSKLKVKVAAPGPRAPGVLRMLNRRIRRANDGVIFESDH